MMLSNVQSLYHSSDYKDELAWAAAWLYKATGSKSYLAQARRYYSQVGPVMPACQAEGHH